MCNSTRADSLSPPSNRPRFASVTSPLCTLRVRAPPPDVRNDALPCQSPIRSSYAARNFGGYVQYRYIIFLVNLPLLRNVWESWVRRRWIGVRGGVGWDGVGGCCRTRLDLWFTMHDDASSGRSYYACASLLTRWAVPARRSRRSSPPPSHRACTSMRVHVGPRQCAHGPMWVQ